MEKIILDANVLYSNTLRGLFLWLAWNKVLSCVWSQEIWDEVFRNHSENVDKEKAFRQHINNTVFSSFPTSMIVLEVKDSSVGLPDKNDEHVVELARQEEINKIVTFNLKDFPSKTLEPLGILATNPDIYLCGLFDQFPFEVKETVCQHIKANTELRPTKTRYFQSLKKANAIAFAKKLEEEDVSNNLFSEVWN